MTDDGSGENGFSIIDDFSEEDLLGLFDDIDDMEEHSSELEESLEEMEALDEQEADASEAPLLPPRDTLPALMERAKVAGLTYSPDGTLSSAEISRAVEVHGPFETRRALISHIEEIFDSTLQKYAGSPDEQEDLQWIVERYDSGDRIIIEDLILYDPGKGDVPAPNVITVPVVNNAANILQVLGVPAGIISQFTRNRSVRAIGTASTHIPSGMKSLNKAYKELRREKKKPLRIARYSIAGLGAIVAGLPIPDSVKNHPVGKYVHRGLTTAYFINQGLLLLKMFPDRVSSEMPAVDVIREDLKKQAGRYHDSLRKYAGKKFQKVGMDDLEEKLTDVNRYLRHHIERIGLEDIDIEYDYSIARMMGAAARADIQHDTCELTTRVLPGDEPWFTWAYVHECMHLDGTKNEGKANYRADRVIEDMAIHNPDTGYDHILEEMRFAAVGHAFAAKLMEEANRTLNEELKDSDVRYSARERQRLVKTFVYNELRSLNLGVEDIRAIARWSFPTKGLAALLRVQSVMGSDPSGGYTLDYYRLLKQEGIL